MKTQIPWGLKMLTACSLRKESIYFMEGSKKKIFIWRIPISEKSRTESWTLATCRGFGYVHLGRRHFSSQQPCARQHQSHPRLGHPQPVDSSRAQAWEADMWNINSFDRSIIFDCTPRSWLYTCSVSPATHISTQQDKVRGWELCPRLCLLHGDRHILVLLELNLWPV